MEFSLERKRLERCHSQIALHPRGKSAKPILSQSIYTKKPLGVAKPWLWAFEVF